MAGNNQGYEDTLENEIVIYPGGVRAGGEEEARSVADQLVQIAENKLHDWSRRERHRRQRRRDLERSIPAEFKRLDNGAEPATLVATFDTLSYPLHDSPGTEGHIGRSIVVLFRERDERSLHFTTDPSDEVGDKYLALPSGRLLEMCPFDQSPIGAEDLLDLLHPMKHKASWPGVELNIWWECPTPKGIYRRHALDDVRRCSSVVVSWS